MKVGLIHPTPPSGGAGGAERLWQALASRLEERGHETELVGLAFPEASLAEVLDGYERFAGLDASRFDVVVTGKYPGWMVEHDRHVVYMLHPLRGLYETYPRARGELGDTEQGRQILQALHQGDDVAAVIASARDQLAILGEDHPLTQFPGPLARWVVRHLDGLALAPNRIARYAAISHVVAGREGYFPPGEPVMVVHPETDLTPVEAAPATSSRFFTAGRHDGPKRFDLVIDAFRSIPDPAATLRIAGDGPLRAELEAGAGDDERISFLGRISEAQLATEYATATAVAFPPADEDFGYVGLEAMMAGTPVVTTSDAGGARELVEHGVNGLIVQPTAEAVGWGLRHIADSPRVRWELGLQARRRAALVTWDPLLDEIEDLANDSTRPNVLFLSTYPVEPMIGGGQRRIRFLARAMAQHCDVTVLVNCLNTTTSTGAVERGQGIRRRYLEPGITQIEVARSAPQVEAEIDMYFALGKVPVDDITAGALSGATPAFGRELDALLSCTDLVVTHQPFLAPALPDLGVPVVHDSQNAESAMKADLLPDSAGGRWLLDAAMAAETEAVRQASFVTACTESDLKLVLELAPDRSVPGLVVGNGVDSGALPFKTETEQRRARAELLALSGCSNDDQRPIALFIGSWHPPNIKAGRLVLELAVQRPDWLFIMAGSHTSEFADHSYPTNVHLIAVFNEPLLWPMLAGADVALNPMVSGGGSNLKMADYLAVGTPVLTTEIGARGLDQAHSVSTVVDPTVAALSTGLDSIMARSQSEGMRLQLRAGRALVEDNYDWATLGESWALATLGSVGLDAGPGRSAERSPTRPSLSPVDPPSDDPVIAAMELVGNQARTIAPTPQDTTMDPSLREFLKFAEENRHMGRRLPADARFRLPKQAIIRLGKALSNEQVTYNESILDAVDHMAVALGSLTAEVHDLQRQLGELSAQNARLERRLGDDPSGGRAAP